jgi:hypothetical protein
VDTAVAGARVAGAAVGGTDEAAAVGLADWRGPQAAAIRAAPAASVVHKKARREREEAGSGMAVVLFAVLSATILQTG